MTDKEKRFLIGLEKLSRETGVIIGGCGCCGSPFLEELEHDEPSAGYGVGYGGSVLWVSPSDKFDWENYGATIIKPDNQQNSEE